MVRLTFYGGANEIGGNKILLEDKDARIYLDFGESFDFGQDFFYDWLQPRSVNGLEVMFEFDLMPKIPGLYSKDALRFTDLPHRKSDIDAVFISHSHSDHVNHLQYLDDSIPVYMGHGTKTVLDAYAKLYPQFCRLGGHDYRLFRTGDRIRIKHLVIEPVHVEHSIPGAYGFIVSTSKGPIVYTGDFRLHGPKAHYTHEFVRKARDAKPYAMLCEGTRMSREDGPNVTERMVEDRLDAIVADSKRLVLAYFSMSNIDRFFSFYAIAKKHGRILAIDTKFAYILDALREKIPELPDPRTDPLIRVYFRLAKSGTFSDKDYQVFEREYLPNRITYREIRAGPERYILHLNFFKLMELVYLQPKDADFIYSSSEHFLEGEENEDQTRVMMNWMSHFGIRFHQAHCSGHADRAGLVHAIERIAPQILIPIHTQSPQEFGKLHPKVVYPSAGKTIEL